MEGITEIHRGVGFLPTPFGDMRVDYTVTKNPDGTQTFSTVSQKYSVYREYEDLTKNERKLKSKEE